MPVKSSASHAKGGMYEEHDCCFSKDCSRAYMRHLKNMDFGRKLLATLGGIFLVYAIVLVGTLIRNNLQSFYFIGRAPAQEHVLMLDAQGKVTIVPDIAMTTMGMISDAPTVAEAQQKNTDTMNKLIEQVKALGIDAKDIQTANYNVYPQYDYTEKDGQKLKGYQVSQNVTVKIRKVENANKVIALAGELGINNVSGITFTIDDKDVYKAQARQLALKKIQEKVQSLESSLGVHLGGVVSYNESENGVDVPMYKTYALDSMNVGAAAPAPNIEAGTNDVILNVSIGYMIQ